jgi:8-oxo-dGTP pyrophosphatase MutT (NUDIX family)
VILMRGGGAHGERGIELLMLQRGADARFMPGVWVFAGGVVDPGDAEAAADAPREVEAEEWAHRICGARELAEEAGIEVAAVDLRPWSRWVTPEPVPARFDTRFYVALAPPHSEPEPDGIEMDRALWIAPGEALVAAERKEMEISFPTIHHLEELRSYSAADAVLAATAERRVDPILPKVVGSRESFEVLLPGDPRYPD